MPRIWLWLKKVGLKFMLCAFVIMIAFIIASSLMPIDAKIKGKIVSHSLAFHYSYTEEGNLFNDLAGEKYEHIGIRNFEPILLNGISLDSTSYTSNYHPVHWRPCGFDTFTFIPSNVESRLVFSDANIETLRVPQACDIKLQIDQENGDLVINFFGGNLESIVELIPGETAIQVQNCKLQSETWAKDVDLWYAKLKMGGESARITVNSQDSVYQVELSSNGSLISQERNVHVKNLSFNSFRNGNWFSSICKQGEIEFPGINGKTLEIDSLDFVEIENSEDLIISSISLTDKGIVTNFSGVVHSLRIGQPGAILDHTPSLLQYVKNSWIWGPVTLISSLVSSAIAIYFFEIIRQKRKGTDV